MARPPRWRSRTRGRGRCVPQPQPSCWRRRGPSPARAPVEGATDARRGASASWRLQGEEWILRTWSRTSWPRFPGGAPSPAPEPGAPRTRPHVPLRHPRRGHHRGRRSLPGHRRALKAQVPRPRGFLAGARFFSPSLPRGAAVSRRRGCGQAQSARPEPRSSRPHGWRLEPAGSQLVLEGRGERPSPRPPGRARTATLHRRAPIVRPGPRREERWRKRDAQEPLLVASVVPRGRGARG